MCKCVTRVQANIVKTLEEKYPEDTISLPWGSGFQNEIMLTDPGEDAKGEPNDSAELYFMFKYSKQFIKKDGSLSALRSHSTSVRGDYCPFCGVKRRKDSSDG